VETPLVIPTTNITRTVTVSVPSDVFHIELNFILLHLPSHFCEGFLMSIENLSKYGRI
jgi:hypothetical protein